MNATAEAVLVGAALAVVALMGFGLWKLCMSASKAATRRRALKAAHRLLQSDRPNDDHLWSMDEWDWAFAKLGTPEAAEQMRIHTKVRGGRARLAADRLTTLTV
ncbi:hypothetical protein [Mycobacterium sp. SMC-17]|uniref:hypothetical protein n=1 Tax=Mycobacterium sp. SMC-17 TaxID=3381628 RepID=UPI0038766C79